MVSCSRVCLVTRALYLCAMLDFFSMHSVVKMPLKSVTADQAYCAKNHAGPAQTTTLT